MSWLQSLCETYDACFGRPQFERAPLAPIDHVEQQAHIEIVLDGEGSFLSAAVVPKENTLIPATEKSAGRTGTKPKPHPLCDKLRYVAADLGSTEHELYIDQLRAWAHYAGQQPKLNSILRYVERGTVVRDLLTAGILVADRDGSLETKWEDGLSPLAKLLTPDARTKERDQSDALVRWRVGVEGELESAVWKDLRLQQEWMAFNSTLPVARGLCISSGLQVPLAFNHPKRLRHGGDGAKLISTNDNKSGFTFRGRFLTADEAYGLGSAATQKAHNALRWLIARQGARNGDQVIVAWAVQTGDPLPLVVDSLQFLSSSGENRPQEPNDLLPLDDGYRGDIGQAFSLRLRNAVRGYTERLGESVDIVVMALDSATPGRMAISYHRELKGSEFLARIEQWHSRLAWLQNFGKDRHFIGAPAPRDIAEAAFGRRIDEKLRKFTVERLLPCIVDGRPLPRDLQIAAVRRASNRIGLERWEFERFLGIACSLVRGAHPKEKYGMNLDDHRSTRDYLYGRLLAIAENIEELALRTAGEQRETNAARLMQRFASQPYATWRTIELALRPYMSRLRGSRFAGALVIRQRLLDSLPGRFPAVSDGTSSFTDNSALSGEFLLGYHCQRQELSRKKSGQGESSADVQEFQGEDR
jgi:CRISPR-associated protein Csd1